MENVVCLRGAGRSAGSKKQGAALIILGDIRQTQNSAVRNKHPCCRDRCQVIGVRQKSAKRTIFAVMRRMIGAAKVIHASACKNIGLKFSAFDIRRGHMLRRGYAGQRDAQSRNKSEDSIYPVQTHDADIALLLAKRKDAAR